MTRERRKSGSRKRRVGSVKRRRAGARRRRKNASVRTTTVVRTGRTRRRARRSSRRRRRNANPGRARYAARTRGKRARVYKVRNRHGKALFRIKGFRARRVNPSTDGLVVAAIAVGAGLVASIGVGYVVDKFMAAKSPAMQTAALAVVAGAFAFFVPNPALAAGVATGLLVVPLAKQVYSWFPSLANPAVPPALAPVPGAAPALSPTAAAAVGLAASAPTSAGGTPVSSAIPAAMNALHMSALHRGMGGGFKRRGNQHGKATPWGMQALHMKGLGAYQQRNLPSRATAIEALHAHGMQALHDRGLSASMRRR